MSDPGAGPDAGEVLNRLLRSAHDSADGFRQGAALARNPTFQTLFRDRAEERLTLVQTIEAEVKSFGADPAGEGSVIGEVNRLVTFGRNSMARDSDKGLIRELVRREGLVMRNFEAVASDDLAPQQVRRLASEALEKLAAEQRDLEGLEGQFSGVGPEPVGRPDRTSPGTGDLPMATHFKLSEEDNGFLATPNGASVLFAGSSGTQTWIERAQDGVVRIGIQSVGVATADGGSLAVSIDVGEETAKGEDGPAPIEHHLNASQSVQLLVKAGERIAFKAYPAGQNAQILRTVVWASDLGAPKS